MDYLEWNNAIASHFFNEANSGKDVYLYATRSDIISWGRETQQFQESTDDEIWADFVQAINRVKFEWGQGLDINRIEIERNNPSIIARVIGVYDYGNLNFFIGQSEYPLYLSFLVVLVLPLAEIDDDNQFPTRGGAYYERANGKLSEYGFTIIDNELCSNTFRKICLNEDDGKDIWQALENWSRQRNLGTFSKPNLQGQNTNRWLRTVFTQALISESEVNRFKLLFSALDLPVGLNLSDEEIANLLRNGETKQIVFRGRENRYQSAINNANLINLFRQKYEKWDGKTRIETTDRNTGIRTIGDEGTRYNIYLTLRFNNNNTIQLRHRIWYKNPTESPETLYFENLRETYLNSNGWSDAEFEVANITQQKRYTDSENNIDAIFRPSEIYLFQQLIQNVWVSRAKYEKGCKYYILVRDNHHAVEWLDANAESLTDYQLPASFLLFRIENAQNSCEGCSLLTLPVFNANNIKITDSNNIIISKDRVQTVFSNLFPVEFKISDITVNHTVSAEFDAPDREQSALEYDEYRDVWMLNDRLYQYEEFKIKIYLNGEQVFESPQKYVYTEPTLNNLQESLRDEFGNYVEQENQAITRGLELIVTDVSALDSTLNAQQQQITKGQYSPEQDALLYAISSIGIMDKKQFREIVGLIIKNQYANNQEVEKDRFDLLNEYERLGFVNYDYYNNESKVTVNKPTLIRLPVRYERIVNQITEIKPRDSYFRAVFVGARTPEFVNELELYCNNNNVLVEYRQSDDNRLLPQQIVLYARKLGDLKKVAQCMQGKFQKNKVFAEILFKKILSITDYTERIIQDENRIYDYPQDAVLYKNFKCLDYGGNLSNKTTFNNQLDLVTYSPGTYKEQTVLWYRGNQYPVDKYWGYFVVMSLMNVVNRHIIVDEINCIIKIPVQLRFPRIYARVFSLMSAMRPNTECIDGVRYKCYYLPLIAPYNREIDIARIKNKLRIN
jgi:hypothetical protein